MFNSVTSFTLIVFTIPLAFDVGGRDCGLVSYLHSHTNHVVDILSCPRDVLLSFIHAAAFIATVKVLVDTLVSGITSEFRHSFNFGMGIKCL